MKALNKLFVMVLAVVMVMSMSVSAFADDDPPAPTTGSIKIENAPAGVGYRVYKIFNAETVTVNDETTVSYSIAPNSPWLDVVYDKTNGTSNITGLTFTVYPENATGDSIQKYIVTQNSGFDTADFADTLKNSIPEGVQPDGQAAAVNSDGSTFNITGLAPGYYMAVSTYAGEDNAASCTTVLAGGEAEIGNQNGSIKIVNAPAQVAYDAYKIFNANTLGEGDETAVIYTIAAESPWLAVVYDTEEEESKITGLVFTPYPAGAEGNAIEGYIVTWETGFVASEFAETIKNNIPQSVTPNAHANAPASGADVVIFNDLAPGYYMVVPSGGGQDDVASITTVLAGQEVVIQNKNDMPLDKTVDNVKYEGVSVGDEVKFRIKSKVPYVNQDDTYYAFYVSDIMSDGLKFDKDSFKVWIDKDDDDVCDEDSNPNDETYDGEEVVLTEISSAAANLSGDQVRYGKNGKTFELSLAMLNRGKTQDQEHPEYEGLAGMDVYIEYTATVTKDAVARLSENYAVLEYGNDPRNPIIKDSKAWVYVAQIIIDKIDSSNPDQKLEGAKFVLYREVTPTPAPAQGEPSTTPAAVKEYYQMSYKTLDSVTGLAASSYEAVTDTENNTTTYYALKDGQRIVVVNWVTNRAEATEVETDNEGSARFVGLGDGPYYLEETKAPVGYVKLISPETIDLQENNARCLTPGLSDKTIEDMLTTTVGVQNTAGTTLPSTGGIGNMTFYVLGAVFVFVGCVIRFIRRRTSS